MALIIRDSSEPREYHGYGPDGYKPGPLHGIETNLDWARIAEQTRKRACVIPAKKGRRTK